MFNYLSTNNNTLIVAENHNINFINKNIEIIDLLPIDTKINFVYKNFFHTSKVLKSFDGVIEIEIKGISQMVEYDDDVYISTRFGDLLSVKRGLLSGSMCYVTDMIVHNKKLVLSDKYGRLKTLDSEGNIFGFHFFGNKPIISILSFNDNIVVAFEDRLVLDNKVVKIIFENEEIRKMVKFNDKIVILGLKTYLVDAEFVVIQEMNFMKDCVFFNEELVYINSENELLYQNYCIKKLDGDYEDYIKQIIKKL